MGMIHTHRVTSCGKGGGGGGGGCSSSMGMRIVSLMMMMMMMELLSLEPFFVECEGKPPLFEKEKTQSVSQFDGARTKGEELWRGRRRRTDFGGRARDERR